MKHLKFRKFFSVIGLGVILFVVFFVLYNSYQSHKAAKQIEQETIAIRAQESLLNLPPPQRRMEKNTGCTWSEKQDWDTEGCYIAVMDVYDQKGPSSGLEENIIEKLNKNSWQKRNSVFSWESLATDMHGGNVAYTKQTSEGKFCAGYDHRYFSDDIVNGHRALYFYILGPSDKSCKNG